MSRSLLLLATCLCTAWVVVGAAPEPRSTAAIHEADSPPAAVAEAPVPPLRAQEPTAAAPLNYLNWYSVNNGGFTRAVGTNFGLGLTTGQSVAESVTGSQYKLGMGFWYGATAGACPIALSGDVNMNGAISASDIIVLVNYALKAGPAPLPCTANGDVNCNGGVSTSDIIVLVNSVFKAGPAPCNVCTVIPSLWTCP